MRPVCYGPCPIWSLRLLCDQSSGACYEAFCVQSEALALASTDRFLMSEYLTLSGPEAVSLLSPESASVNSSSVIRSSFELASVRVLSSPFQIAFLSSWLFRSLCWTGRWSTAEPFSLLVCSTAPLSSMRSGVVVVVVAAQSSICR